MSLRETVSLFVAAFFKAYRVTTGSRSVDDVLGAFSKAVVSLRAIEAREVSRSGELRAEAIRLTAEADAAATEAYRAAGIANNIVRNFN